MVYLFLVSSSSLISFLLRRPAPPCRMYSVVLPSAGDLLQSARVSLPAEEGERSAGHESKGKPTANFPREEEGDIMLYR